MLDDRPWSEAAKLRLDEAVDIHIRNEKLDGTDAEELREDLKHHVYETLAESENEQIISVSQLVPVLEKMGLNSQPKPNLYAKAPEISLAKGYSDTKKSTDYSSSILAWFFGVILPAIVLILELITSMCGATFFDPISSPIHVVLVALVPVMNTLLIQSTHLDRPRSIKIFGLLAGCSVGVSAIYALLFLPMLPLSLLAVLYLGFGLLSLSPIIAWLCASKFNKNYREKLASHKAPLFKRYSRIGCWSVIALLILLELPGIYTHSGIRRALSSDADTAAKGLAQLRFYHHSDTLLKNCYRSTGGNSIADWLSLVGGIIGLERQIFPESETRTLFFRVTGKPYNSVRPDKSISAVGVGMGRRQRTNFDEVIWDNAIGGDHVAARVKGLSMQQSRIDGHIDSKSSLGYSEWTLVFGNTSSRPQEARLQMQLPPEGVVSRLTLWVNGEPREAAFNSVAKVKKAYQSVAVIQRKDPVLVTSSGPDRVMVQCFPVPPSGEIKIRLGITSPLVDQRLFTPYILEQNFSVAKDLKHSLWMQGDVPITLPSGQTSHPDGTAHSASAQLAKDCLWQPDTFISVSKAKVSDRPLYTIDPFAAPHKSILLRQIEEKPAGPPRALIVVVDGSVALNDHIGWIADSLENVEFSHLILAHDDKTECSVEELKAHTFSGGRDNAPALLHALSLAKTQPHSQIVWIHGPQPIILDSTESMRQLLDRGQNHPNIYSIPIERGNNELFNMLNGYRCMKMGPRLVEKQADLARFLKELSENPARSIYSYSRRVSEEGLLPEQKVWDQLARYWAAEESRKGYLVDTNDPKKISFAAQYQLVTPYSGAVVLETAEQFKEHGLKPIDSNAAPNIPNTPEPTASLLLLIGTLLSLTRRNRY